MYDLKGEKNLMNIRFGSNEYEMLPNSGLDTYDGSLHLSLLADNVDFEDLEEVLLDKDNLDPVKVIENNIVTQSVYGYTKLYELKKEYDVLWWTEQVMPEPAEEEEEDYPEAEIIEHRADVYRIILQKPELKDQVDENTANIEFIAIMSDIEL